MRLASHRLVLFWAIANILFSPLSLAAPAELATAEVRVIHTAAGASFDGVIEAVRQTDIAAQISGEIVAITVKPGDSVHAGQVLLRIDSQVADQVAAASEAQVSAAKVAFEFTQKEFDRQRQLVERHLISRAAFERAEAEFKSSSAQAQARIAEASAMRTQSGFFIIKAPYAGIITRVPVVTGDLALPGKLLLTLYGPAALRVTAAIPHDQAARLNPTLQLSIQIELADRDAKSSWLKPVHTQVLPAIDPSTHTMELRLDLPPNTANVAPGLFVRVWLPADAATNSGIAGNAGNEEGEHFFVPASALVRRAEMTGVYVVGAGGSAQLRQVRAGRRLSGDIEILAGISSGEKVALDPDAAARQPQ